MCWVGYVTAPGLMGFVAKKEMLRYPCLRSWMRLVNCVFLDRKNVKEALKAIMEAIGKLKDGISMWIFPEGTRNVNDNLADLMEFREGSLKMAEKSGCPGDSRGDQGDRGCFRGSYAVDSARPCSDPLWQAIDLKTLPKEERKFPAHMCGEC